MVEAMVHHVAHHGLSHGLGGGWKVKPWLSPWSTPRDSQSPSSIRGLYHGIHHGVVHAVSCSMVNTIDDDAIRYDIMPFAMVCRMVMGCPITSPVKYPSNSQSHKYHGETMDTQAGIHERHHQDAPWHTPYGWFRFRQCAMVYVPSGQPWERP